MDRNLSRSFGAGGRKYRYSGAHTTALDSVSSSPRHPEMSYTARKYSVASYGTSYSPYSARNSSGSDRDAGRTGGSLTDRSPSSGYSSSYLTKSPYTPSAATSRRGSASSDLGSTSNLNNNSSSNNNSASSYGSRIGSHNSRSSYLTSGSLGNISTAAVGTSNLKYNSNTDLSGSGSRYSAERNGDITDKSSMSSGRCSRQSSTELAASSPGRYSRGSSTELNTPGAVTPVRSYSRLSNCTESYSSSRGVSSHNSGELPLSANTSSRTISRYSRQNSAELSSSPSPTPSAFINGYATLERRTNRRKREYLAERRSAERVGESVPYSGSTLCLKKYTRTYSCDLPNRRLGSRDYTVPKAGLSSRNGQDEHKDGSRPPSVDRERSPSIVAIYEGLARINEALQRCGAKPNASDASGRPGVTSSRSNGSMSLNTAKLNGRNVSACSSTTDVDQGKTSRSSTASTTPTSYSSSVSLDQSVIKEAFSGCLSPKMKSPRSRTNNFVSRRDTSVESQINVVPDIVIPAEARLAQRRAARAEARELRLRELEKQQQDQENEEEKQFTTPSFAEPSPRATVASRTSVGRTALNSTGQYSRRSSEDSTTDESALPANVREMRAELKELDEKFRKAMITNAQLDNEKSTLTYEVELIKDKYTELEETHTQLNKEHRRKCTEYEQLRKVSTKLQEEVKILRGMLQERDQLIQEYGLIVVGEEEENGEVPPEPDEFDDMDDLTPRKIAIKKVLLSQEAAELLEKGAAKGSLDVRLKKFGEEKNDLEDQVRRLKLELEEERNKNRRRENGLDYEKAKEQSKTVNEYKFRVQKAEAEVLTLQANVARLDALSTRYKTQSEELEKSEEELKVERRKLQRELRDAQSRLEELETTNNHLIRRFDKLKNARSNLLKDLSQDPA